MRESELANLMVQMGLDRGLTIEQVAAELSTLGMPTFVDAGAFRSTVLQAAETQLRSQLEVQINRLRQQAGLSAAAGAAAGSATPGASFAPTIPPVNAPQLQQPPVTSVADPTSPAPPVPSTLPAPETPPAPVVETVSVDPPSNDLEAVVASLGGSEQPVRETEYDIPADATVVWTNFDTNRGRPGS